MSEELVWLDVEVRLTAALALCGDQGGIALDSPLEQQYAKSADWHRIVGRAAWTYPWSEVEERQI